MQEEVFDYLLELRDSGITNMLGAGSYLQNAFGFERKEASEWLGKWMNSFKEKEEK